MEVRDEGGDICAFTSNFHRGLIEDMRAEVYAPTPEPDSFGRPMFSVGGYASTSAMVSSHH